MKNKLLAILSVLIIGFSFFYVACGQKEEQVSVTFVYSDNAPTAGIGAIADKKVLVEKEAGVTPPQTEPVDKYYISGWYCDRELSQKWDFENVVVKSMELYAKWERLYYIEYILSEGVNHADNPDTFIKDEVVVLEPAYKEGHGFAGWYTDPEMSANKIERINVSGAGGDITVYAKFLRKNLNFAKISINIDNSFPLSGVTREEYVNAEVSLTETIAEFSLNNVKAEFKGRGNGSWGQDKKGYRIKFKDKQSIFGNTKSKHWALIPGQSDATMLRNGLAYSIVNNDLSNIEYTTSVNYVDFFCNNEYRGVYLMAEHIRVDEGRVEIESKYGVLDTGYLIEYDAYAASEGEKDVFYFELEQGLVKYPFTVKSPDPEEYAGAGLTKEQFKAQVAYIKDYMQRTYRAALDRDFAAFSALADVNSFVDMYIIHELFKNTDSGWSSFYMYKKPGGKIFFGPAWDFDLSAGLSRGDSSYAGIYVADTIRTHSDYTSSEIFIALMENSSFRNAVKARWKNVSAAIKTTVEDTVSYVQKYEAKFQRESDKWAQGKNWANETSYLKNWLTNRIGWLNNHWN